MRDVLVASVNEELRRRKLARLRVPIVFPMGRERPGGSRGGGQSFGLATQPPRTRTRCQWRWSSCTHRSARSPPERRRSVTAIMKVVGAVLVAVLLAVAYGAQMSRWLRVLQREHYDPRSMLRFLARWSSPLVAGAKARTRVRPAPSLHVESRPSSSRSPPPLFFALTCLLAVVGAGVRTVLSPGTLDPRNDQSFGVDSTSSRSGAARRRTLTGGGRARGVHVRAVLGRRGHGLSGCRRCLISRRACFTRSKSGEPRSLSTKP